MRKKWFEYRGYLYTCTNVHFYSNQTLSYIMKYKKKGQFLSYPSFNILVRYDGEDENPDSETVSIEAHKEVQEMIDKKWRRINLYLSFFNNKYAFIAKISK